MASRRQDIVNSTTAVLGNSAARGPASYASKATASGVRNPPEALPPQSSRPTYSSRLGPQNDSRPQPSNRSNLLNTAAANRASLYTARGTNAYIDRYVPNYGQPERSNPYPTNRSERSHNGNGRSSKYEQILSRSMYKPGIIRFLHTIRKVPFRKYSANLEA